MESNDTFYIPHNGNSSSGTTRSESYRPSLTGENIETILKLAHAHIDTMTPQILDVIGKLAPFYAKVKNSGIKPAHIGMRKESLEESLGITSLTEPAIPKLRPMSPSGYEDIRRIAYERWTVCPELCTPHELELVATYRYEKGMMNTEETVRFELGLAKGFFGEGTN